MSKREHKQTPELRGRLSGEVQKAFRKLVGSPRARSIMIAAGWVIIVVGVAGFGSRALVLGLVGWETGRVFSEQPLTPPRTASPPGPQVVSTAPSKPELQAAAPPAQTANRVQPKRPTPQSTVRQSAAPPPPVAIDLSHMYWPVQGRIVESNGWVRDPYTQAWHYEPGVLLEAAAGNAIHAALPGTVSDVGPDARGEERVSVKGADDWSTTYTGNFSPAVTVGQHVDPGATIGRLMGAEAQSGGPEVAVGPGTANSGAWVEFVLQHGNAVVDPLPYAPK